MTVINNKWKLEDAGHRREERNRKNGREKHRGEEKF